MPKKRRTKKEQTYETFIFEIVEWKSTTRSLSFECDINLDDY